MTTRVLRTAVALLLGLALTGCSEGKPPPARQLDSASQAPAPSAEGSEVSEDDANETASATEDEAEIYAGSDPTELIQAADSEFEEVGYTLAAFELAYGYALTVGDASGLEKLSSPSCKLCQDAIEHAKSMVAQDQRMKVDDIASIDDIYVAAPAPEKGMEYHTAVLFGEMEPKVIIDADGNEVDTIRGGLLAEAADLEKVDGRWRIVQVTRTSDEEANLVLNDRPFERIELP